MNQYKILNIPLVITISMYLKQTRKTKIQTIAAKSSTAFLQRIVDRRNNFDDDIVSSVILELKNRKVVA